MDNSDDRNIRPVLQLLGDQGLMAQGAQNEILVSLLKSELGFTIPITIATLPTIGVSSLPNLVVATMPSLTVGSLPNLTVASMPSLTANPTRPTLLAQVLLTAADATLYTAAANYRDVIVYLKNVDTSARTATIALGANITNTTALVTTLPCEVGCRIPVCIPALTTGQVLCGLCDAANKVAVEVWGIPV